MYSSALTEQSNDYLSREREGGKREGDRERMEHREMERGREGERERMEHREMQGEERIEEERQKLREPDKETEGGLWS